MQTETRDSQENVGFGFISKEVDRLAKRKISKIKVFDTKLYV